VSKQVSECQFVERDYVNTSKLLPPPWNTPARPTTNIRLNEHPPGFQLRNGMNFFLNFLTTFLSRHSPASASLWALYLAFPLHLHNAFHNYTPWWGPFTPVRPPLVVRGEFVGGLRRRRPLTAPIDNAHSASTAHLTMHHPPSAPALVLTHVD